MKTKILCLVFLFAVVVLAVPALADPLPSWNDTEARAGIIEFVERVTDPASEDYVTPADRIAVFDNDGTLWSEKPIYFQGLFAIDRLREMAAEDESILSSDALRAAAQGDLSAVAAAGEAGLMEILATTHSGLKVDAFIAAARDWMASARHPGTGMAYNDMVYQPMLELLRYLRDQGFSTWIVSGGGLHFIRAFAEQAYNIPPHQVIGTTGKASYVVTDGEPAIMKDPSIFFIDDNAGKPLAIEARIGKRPILAVGNSDGDFEMLEWTTSGEGPRLRILIHHTDGEREFAYDRDSPVGRLARGLDEGPERGWLIVDMARDWARIWAGR
jgi:phosphoglycolate phosphatase-like HAD superfamily hydrolase